MTAEEGRQLWQQVLEDVTESSPFSPVLHHILESVLVDVVDNRMRLSDDFAIAIGNRINVLMRALAEGSSA